MSIEFLLTSLVVIILPGTGVVLTLAAALSRGFAWSAMTAFACTIAILPHAAAAILGLAALLHASALAFEVVKFAGVGYLLYLGWQTLREQGAMTINPDAPRASATRTFVVAMGANALNPKLSVFFLAFLPQFVSPQSTAPALEMAALAAVFMGLTFAVFVVYGALASLLRQRVLSSARIMAWLRRSFAAAFGLLAVRLALAER